MFGEKRIILDIETAARIESGVKENGRSIADANLRLMGISSDIKEVKEDIRSMTEGIAEMQENIKILSELNIEQRKENKKIGLILEEIMQLQKEIRKDLDKALDREKDMDEEYMRVGAM